MPIDNPHALTRAVETLEAGDLVAFPTDTVYGVGALVHEPESIAKLYVIKERDLLKAILTGDISKVETKYKSILKGQQRLLQTALKLFEG